MADKQRGLTTGEIKLAKSIFGDAIDYSQVRIHDGKVPGFIESRAQDDYTPVPTSGRDIYAPPKAYSDDYSAGDSKGSFIHMMAYVWQFQAGIEKPEDVKNFLKSNMFHQDRIKQAMELTVDPNKDFKAYNIEQRAQLLEDLYNIRDRQAHPEAKAPDDPDGKEMLKKYAQLAKDSPNSFMVKYATIAYGITKDAQGQYHVDPQKWQAARAETQKIEAESRQRDANVEKIVAKFVADPHYLDPSRQAKQAAAPTARPRL